MIYYLKSIDRTEVSCNHSKIIQKFCIFMSDMSEYFIILLKSYLKDLYKKKHCNKIDLIADTSNIKQILKII